jgi:hypothetical protein
MKLKLKPLSVAVGLAVAMTAGMATAAPLPLYPDTLFQDDNRDLLITDANGDGKLDVGDRLMAVFEINSLENFTGTGTRDISTLGKELTGISVIEVKSVTPIVPGFSRIEFGPSSVDWATLGFGLPAGFGDGSAFGSAMVAMWVDTSPDLELTDQTVSCATVAGCVANAIDGDLYQVDGFADVDDQWFSLGATDVGGVAGLPAATKVALFNYALTTMFNGTGYEILHDKVVPCLVGFSCAGDGIVDMIGSGDVLGGSGLTNGFQARSDFDFIKDVRPIPEPATLALLGIGLLGIGANLRKRKA